MLLNEMEIFYYVAEYKSFSKAADRLRVSKSFISKKISKLEHELKAHLIGRSTRKLTLSAAGESFYRYCANVVREGQEAYSMINELQGKPSGILKISMPPALGLNLIARMLPDFLSQHPDVTLNIALENRLVDVIKEGYDLVLRSAILESSNLIAQKIFSIKNCICATESYLQQHGYPTVPADLEKHIFAIYSYTKNAAHITLAKNGHEEMIYVQGNFMSNHLDLIKHMVLKDTCMALLPQFMVTNELQEKKLIFCLSDYQLRESPLYAVYPEKKFMLPTLKKFLEMLKENFQQ